VLPAPQAKYSVGPVSLGAEYASGRVLMVGSVHAQKRMARDGRKIHYLKSRVQHLKRQGLALLRAAKGGNP